MLTIKQFIFSGHLLPKHKKHAEVLVLFRGTPAGACWSPGRCRLWRVWCRSYCKIGSKKPSSGYLALCSTPEHNTILLVGGVIPWRPRSFPGRWGGGLRRTNPACTKSFHGPGHKELLYKPNHPRTTYRCCASSKTNEHIHTRDLHELRSTFPLYGSPLQRGANPTYREAPMRLSSRQAYRNAK